jgi:hypothetical protein
MDTDKLINSDVLKNIEADIADLSENIVCDSIDINSDCLNYPSASQNRSQAMIN